MYAQWRCGLELAKHFQDVRASYTQIWGPVRRQIDRVNPILILTVNQADLRQMATHCVHMVMYEKHAHLEFGETQGFSEQREARPRSGGQ